MNDPLSITASLASRLLLAALLAAGIWLFVLWAGAA